MPLIQYEPKNFREATQDVIDAANVIIKKYQAMGFKLTLRQLYYQFVAADMLPNSQKSYTRLGSIINDARMAGQVDWDAIEDRTRNVVKPSAWSSPRDIVSACATQYQRDKWATQKNRVEVWIEKEALVGVIEGICADLNVPYFACRGYVSQSEQWGAGHKRFRQFIEDGYQPVIVHLGDHDPSGIDMTRDIEERLTTFARGRVIVQRIALNMSQVVQHNPPPNPAKSSDSRFEAYYQKYGPDSWELDALDPLTIAKLIETEVLQWRDEPLYAIEEQKEREEKCSLRAIADNWTDTTIHLADEIDALLEEGEADEDDDDD